MKKKKQQHPEAQTLPSAFSLFRPSFEALMVNVWTFLCLLLVPIALLTIMNVFGEDLKAGASTGSQLVPVVLLLGGIVSLLLAPAIPYVQIQSVRGNEVTVGEAVQAGLAKFWRFYGLSLLVALYIIGGFLLLIVPGFFMIKRYLLAAFYLYDQDLKIMEAMNKSAEDSRKVPGAIWGVIGVHVLLSMLSALPVLMLVSAFFSVMYYCAPAVRYTQIRALLGKH